ncbi:carbon-nitrogen hydrolase [Kalaharituber pfeilii]|nr:carbon-nitrogen hydrolase [Kalaharituber pfeilii]
MPLAAVAQFRATASPARNLALISHLARVAASHSAGVLFLPEASDYILPAPAPASSSPADNTAITATSSSAPASRPAPPDTSDFVPAIHALARKYNICISIGVHEPVASTAGADPANTAPPKTKNVSLYIPPTGPSSRYEKLHLFDVDLRSTGGPLIQESNSTIPGTGESALIPVPTPIGNLGQLICFDLRFPEPALRLRRLGATVLSYPSAFTVPTGSAHWDVLLRARAIENQCWVVAAAQVGRNAAGRESYGGAIVVDPWGGVSEDEVLEGKEGWEVGGEMGLCLVEIGGQGEVDEGDPEVDKVRREVPLRRRNDVYPEI